MRLFFLLLAASLVYGETITFQIAPSPENRLALEVEKSGLMRGKKHLFLFNRYKGTLAWDAAAPADSKAELVIDAASIDCKDTWVSAKDLKKIQEHALNEMLDAARHPEITFVSAKVTPAGEGQFTVDGVLTIRGMARPVSMSVTAHPGPRFDGAATIRMTAYGMKPPSAALGTIGTKDEMSFRFSVIPLK
jgi:polyisoprenoid-binding protein YceI